jgi:septum site-determining protein MinC
MVFESSLSTDNTSDAPASSLVSCCSQVQIKPEGDRLLLILPREAETNLELPWSEVWQELKHLLQKREQSWQPDTCVCLVTRDRLIDMRQLETIAETLKEVGLKLTTVNTTRRQTAVAAATAGYSVEQNNGANVSPLFGVDPPTGATELLAEPLYIQQTVRSGVEIRHSGTIIICGDLNPGGVAIAAGDIFVWGRLRGVAHAGARGNRKSHIMALQMEFTQLRIADTVARSPQSLPNYFEPEVAFVSKTGISLARASDFAKTHLFSVSEDSWIRTNN